MRFLPRVSADYSAWTAEIAQHGIAAFAVITGESYLPEEQEAGNWGEGIRRIAAQYPLVHAFQVGNEVDHVVGSGTGSTPQLPSTVATQLQQARVALGEDALIIAPGMAGGLQGARYLAALQVLGALDVVDAVACHIYATAPKDLPTLIGAYQAFGKPVWVSEIGIPHGYMNSEDERAVYFSEALGTLAQLGVALASAFVIADACHSEHGLCDLDLNPYPAWAAISGAAAALG
ncbi:MAG TPA: glycosyl hydrolase [Chloroflexota bacterium]